MGRPKELLKSASLRAFRTVALGVRADVAYFLLLPYSLLRGVRPALADRKVPASRLPVDGAAAPDFLSRWRFHARMHQRWLPVLWSDSWATPHWRSRFGSEGQAGLAALSARKPIVLMTVHTTDVVVLADWLVHQGLGVGLVTVDRRVQSRMESRWGDPRWKSFSDSVVFMVGDTRAMIRYLAPGRSMLLLADHLHGKHVEATWEGGRLCLATGGFRIARLTDAIVVPAVVTDAGRWRYRIHLGRPVPQALIESGDDRAAASHVASELMPVVARYPRHAASTLVSATLPTESLESEAETSTGLYG